MKTLLKSRACSLLILITAICFTTVAQNQKVVEAFSKSYAFEKDKDYTNSIASLKEQYDSTSYEMNLRMGWLTYNAGLYKSSLGYYQKATQKFPGSEEAKLGLAYPTYAIGNINDLVQNYKSILEKNPANTACCYNLGLIYYNQKDYKNAYVYFKKIIEYYPFDYNGLLMSGWSEFQQGNKEEAKSLFSKVLMYSPGDQSATEGLTLSGGDPKKDAAVDAAFSKSYTAALNNDYTGAINALKNVYDKTSYEINLRLGYLNYLAGLNKEAMDYYKQAMSINPKALEPRFGYVYPAAALGQVNDLFEEYKNILQIDAQNYTANYRLGYLYYQKKDYPNAYKHLEKAVALYPFTYDGLLLFAKTSYQMGNKTEAKNLFSQVLLLSSNDKEAHEALNNLK